MVSTRGVRYKFSEGERVLCYEPDPTKAKVLYDSKVLEVIENKDKRGRRTVEYLIHFQGWNSSWDRCVGEDFVLKDTEENRQLQRDLAEKSQLQLGAYLYRRERKKGSTTGAAGSSAAKRSRHRFSDDGSSSSTQPDEQENEEAGDAEPEADGENSQESPEEEIKQEIESDSSESSEEEPRAHASAVNHVPAPVGRAHLTLPPVLRDRLTFDYHLIVKRNCLTRLPASPCAAQILESFVKWFARAGAWQTPRGRNEPPQKPDLADVSRRLNLVREVADGIRVYFDFIMRGNLLYKPELAQYHQVCGQFLDQQERKMKEELESDGLSQDEYDDDAASAEEDMKSPKIPEYSHLPPDPVQAPEVQENGDMMDVIDIKQEIKEEPEDAEEMQEDAEEMPEEMDAQLQEEMQEAMRREMQGDLPEGEEMQQQIKEEIEDQEDYQEEAQEDYHEESQDGMQEEMQEAHEVIQEESQQELIRVVKYEIEKVIEEVVREVVIEEMLDVKEKVKKELIEAKDQISEEKDETKDEKQDIKAIKDNKIDEEVPVKIKQEKEDSNDAQNCQSAMEVTEQTSELPINEKIDTQNDSMEEKNQDTEEATKEVKVTESQSQEKLCIKSESHHREGLRSHVLEGRDGLRTHTTESNGKTTESSGKSTESRDQVSESRGQVSESRGQVSESRDQVSESRDQVPESRDQVPESHNQTSESRGQNSEDHHREGHSQVSEGNHLENRRQTTEGHSRELRSQVSESHSREGLRSHTSEGHHIREGLRSQSMDGHHRPRSPVVEDSFANTVRRELRPNTRSRRGNNSPAVGIYAPAVSNSSSAVGNNSPAVGSNSPAFERGNSSPGFHRGNNSPSVQRGNNSPAVQRGNNSPAKEDVSDQVTAEDPNSFVNTVRNQINRPATRGQRRRWNTSPATPAMREGHSSGCAPEAPLITEIKQEPGDSRPATRIRTRSGNRKSINSPAVKSPPANSSAVDSPPGDSPAVNSSEEATGSHEGHSVVIKQERDAETIRPATRSGNVARRLRSHKSAVSQSENEEPQPSTSTAEPRHFEHSSSVGSGSGSSNEEWPKPAEPAPSPASSTRTPLSLLLEKVSQYEIIPREGTEHLPCRVYGAIHLARLFVRLPDFLNATPMSDFKLKLVVKHIDMFIQYLVEHKEWFGEKYYYCDSMSRST